MPALRTLADVVDWRLCLGCGACQPICPSKNVRLVDFTDEGIRPVVADPAQCGSCRDCLEVCPVVETDFTPQDPIRETTSDLERDWGPVLEIWEGHAADPEIRVRASSGGALTALSLYALEHAGLHGVLHIASDPADPVRNRTQLSQTRKEVLAAMGSRYAPASVCDGLDQVAAAHGPCVVIGKPVEIAAVRRARRLRPEIDRRVGLTLSFFCAETPPTRATLELLRRENIPADNLSSLRYRGDGWPGHFAPTVGGEATPRVKIPYRESWAFLQKYRPWATQLWPDGAGEQADIVCGDPWYVEPDGVNPGSSLIVVRTETGRRHLAAARTAGYLNIQPAEPRKLFCSQAGLRAKKGSTWGRRIAAAMLGLPITRLKGLRLFRIWTRLPFREQLASFLGTWDRIFARGFHRRQGRKKSPAGHTRAAAPTL